MRYKRSLLSFALSVCMAACSSKPPPVPVEAPVPPPQKEMVTTSFYGHGDKFHGRRTASGEIFDKNKLTAAHRTLPFGTVLKVTNPVNGKSVTVRVNDRGPHIRGRELDLSWAAAKALGITGAGVKKVEIKRVE